ncbi:hypothetical protein ACH4MK_32820 [Streptomyces rochei]|uniref:hypothetical protein n=1 Tax=Streptomyces rochei TaxID=1928 RepID=UPI0037B622D8
MSSTQGCAHPSPLLKNAVSSTPTPVVILQDIVVRQQHGRQSPLPALVSSASRTTVVCRDSAGGLARHGRVPHDCRTAAPTF